MKKTFYTTLVLLVLLPTIGTSQIIISEDFSDNGATWDEYDPDSKISFNQRLDFTNWIRTDEGYVHKEIEPVSDFVLEYDFNILNKWGNANMVGPLISTVEGSITDLIDNQGDGIWLEYYAGYGAGKVYIQPIVDGVYQTDFDDQTRRIPVNLNTSYYVRFEKVGNNLTLSIFSDPERTVHINGSPISIQANLSSVEFDHFYATNSSVSLPPDNPEWTTGWVDNIELRTFNDCLIASYPFYGDANDTTLNGHDGTVYGANLTYDRKGDADHAYAFDGIDDYIILPYSTAFDFNNQDFTINVWMESNWTGTGYDRRIVNYGGSYWNDYGITYLDDGRVIVWIADSPYYIFSTESLADGEPHLISFVRDNTNNQLLLYIDGMLDGSIVGGSGNMPHLQSDRRLTFGRKQRIDGTEDLTYFKGKIDDVAVYQCALSANEIAGLAEFDPPTVDLGDDITICQGENITLNAGNEGSTYLWSTGETTQTIEVGSTGEYSVTVSNEFGTDSDEMNLTVNPLPTVEAGDTSIIYIGYSPTTTQLNASGGVDYTWSPIDGLNDPNIPNPIAQPTTSTFYTVYATDVNGCSSSDSTFVIVIDVQCGNNQNKVLICHVPPGNPENRQTVCVSQNAVPAMLAQGSYLGPCQEQQMPLSINEQEFNNEVSIYPNPSTGIINMGILLYKKSKVTISLYSPVGALIFDENLGNMVAGKISYKINLMSVLTQNKLTSGVYFLKIQLNDQIINRKILIQN